MRADVQRLQLLGFEPFPCAADKRPRVKWQEPAPVSGWDWRDDDLIGLPLPPDTVAVDIDDLSAVRDSDLVFVQSAAQTTQSGGLHVFYRTEPGRNVPQVVRRGGIGLDTRVGGRPAKGYVIAWEPPAISAVEEWAMAPAWVYEEPRKPNRAEGDNLDAPMGTRWDILSFLGRIASRTKLTEAEYTGILTAARAEGRIVALDAKRPWTDKDLRVLASEAAAWEPVAPAPELFTRTFRPPPAESSAWTGTAIMDAQLPPLVWRVPALLPEGLAVMAAPPKSGKSVLCYQLTAAVVAGGEVLGQTAAPGPVLYYALEDGVRRAQSRLTHASGGRRDGFEQLEVRFDAPALGGPLETQVEEWLAGHEGGLVIIDVLAKVRPAAGKSNQNAYDADYGTLSLLHRVAKQHPGSTILVVTHDRKAGSDDWMTRVTGTRGVTGTADSVIFIQRKRGKPDGTIFAAGRDQEDVGIEVIFDDGLWRVATMADLRASKMNTISDTRKVIMEWLEGHGPAHPQAIADATGFKSDIVRHRVADMVKDGQLSASKDGYFVPEEL